MQTSRPQLNIDFSQRSWTRSQENWFVLFSSLGYFLPFIFFPHHSFSCRTFGAPVYSLFVLPVFWSIVSCLDFHGCTVKLACLILHYREFSLFTWSDKQRHDCIIKMRVKKRRAWAAFFQIFLWMVNDEDLCSCRRRFAERFAGFLGHINLQGLAADHSARTKRFADELTLFTQSGTLSGP